MHLHHTRIHTPIGELLLVADEKGLTYVAFADENHVRCTEGSVAGATPILNQAEAELSEYFTGQRREFTTPLSWTVDTVLGFRGQVQRMLLEIPYGSSMTYKELAAKMENPGAVRAVGSACATNPLPIFSPCHRVLRSDGALGGYRGGLETKQWLLELEKR
ncbi:Methylated-DNA--protein-cysteine methyltransferase, constitutive [Corynebacterium faecale]|nr:Methylated-DNA--protein-cysteine methyltransferase, constitutive [Corynebacterium faecale]